MKAPCLIHHFLEKSAKRFPDKIALVHEDVRATYAAINSQANRLARCLSGRGVAKGQRVVFIFKNSLEYVVSYYGILKSGAVAVPLSTDLKPDGLQRLLDELQPSAVIASSRFERLLKAVELGSLNIGLLIIDKPRLAWSDAAVECIQLEAVTAEGPAADCGLPIDKTQLASIIYTSGSTGSAKGVMLSHDNIVANTRAICQYLQLSEKDIQMVVLPFFYVMGKSLLNTHFAVGGTVVVNNKFAYPASVVQQMLAEQVTGFSGVPSTYAYLLHRSPLKKYRERLKSLRYCSQAGGHMAQPLKRQLRDSLPAHTKIFIMYGATEAAARLSYLDPQRFEDKMGSIGKPIAGVEIRVLDSEGRPVPAGQPGELVASGPNIMQGYWKDAAATQKVLTRHGYRTGDLGYRDADGYLFVSGRRDHLLKVGGHRVNPQEVEEALLATGLTIEAVVVGMADPLLGTRLIAVAVPANGQCTEQDVMRACAEKLPKHKLPAEVKLLRALPKDASGKINRQMCVQMLRKNRG